MRNIHWCAFQEENKTYTIIIPGFVERRDMYVGGFSYEEAVAYGKKRGRKQLKFFTSKMRAQQYINGEKE